jgi:hypothetical protein
MRQMSITLPTSPLSERGPGQSNSGGGGGGGDGGSGDTGEEMGRSSSGGGEGEGEGEGGGRRSLLPRLPLSLLPATAHPRLSPSPQALVPWAEFVDPERETKVIAARAFGLSLQLERAGADLAIVVVGVDAVGKADGQSGGVAVGQMITHVVFFLRYYSPFFFPVRQ